MAYLAIELILIALLAGFFGLTQYEQRRGVRIASRLRTRADRAATRIAFVYTHVDFSKLIHEVTRNALEKFAHDSAHLALQATRFLERQLTQIVQYFRARFAARHKTVKATTPGSSSYMRAMADFKKELRTKGPAEDHDNPSA